MLRLAFIIGTDADPTGPTYKKACYIAARLQPLFDQNIEPEGVLGMIEAAGGLKRLYGDEEAPEGSRGDASEDARRGGDTEPAVLGADLILQSMQNTWPHRTAQLVQRLPQQEKSGRRLVRSVAGPELESDDCNPLMTEDDAEFPVGLQQEALMDAISALLNDAISLIAIHATVEKKRRRP